MATRADSRWIPRAILIGAGYAAVGIVFAGLANPAPSNGIRVSWRLAAWVVSGAFFGSQIAYESVRLRIAPRAVALHAALAAALGGLGLAASALNHSRAVSGHFPSSALAIWPVLVGVPAFVVALATAAGIARVTKPG